MSRPPYIHTWRSSLISLPYSKTLRRELSTARRAEAIGGEVRECGPIPPISAGRGGGLPPAAGPAMRRALRSEATALFEGAIGSSEADRVLPSKDEPL
jgi:hypothetical protein